MKPPSFTNPDSIVPKGGVSTIKEIVTDLNNFKYKYKYKPRIHDKTAYTEPCQANIIKNIPMIFQFNYTIFKKKHKIEK